MMSWNGEGVKNTEWLKGSGWYSEAREHPAMAVSHSVFSPPLNYDDAVCDSVACGTSVTTLALFVVFACDKYAVAVALLGAFLMCKKQQMT